MVWEEKERDGVTDCNHRRRHFVCQFVGTILVGEVDLSSLLTEILQELQRSFTSNSSLAESRPFHRKRSRTLTDRHRQEIRYQSTSPERYMKLTSTQQQEEIPFDC